MQKWVIVVITLWLSRGAEGAEKPSIAAERNLPTLQAAYVSEWQSAPLKHIAAAQVEQESQWNEKATLKTSRELGRGLVQMTVTKRFNIYKDAVRYKTLRDWDWQKDPYNARNQLIFLVLQDRENYLQSKAVNAEERWKMALVRYNAGGGRINARRRYATAAGMKTDRWTGGLEDAHGPLENSILYGRPLWKAVNEYPRVIFRRATKYEGRLK